MSVRQRQRVLPISSRIFGVTCSDGRFFDQLLMAALDGALALEERGHVAVLVGQHLELDVARLLDELLHVELAVAEGVGGLGGAAWKRLGSSSAVRTMRMPRPPPPALALRMTG